jgi:hypothetical protein
MTLRQIPVVVLAVIACCSAIDASEAAATRSCRADDAYVVGRLEVGGRFVYAIAPLDPPTYLQATATRVIAGRARSAACWAVAEAGFNDLYRRTAYIEYIDALCTRAEPHPDYGDPVPTGGGIVARATTLHVRTSGDEDVDFYGGLSGAPVNCDDREEAPRSSAELEAFRHAGITNFYVASLESTCREFAPPAAWLWDALGYLGCPQSRPRPEDVPPELGYFRDFIDPDGPQAIIDPPPPDYSPVPWWRDWCNANNGVGSQNVFVNLVDNVTLCAANQYDRLVRLYGQQGDTVRLCRGLAHLDYEVDRLLFRASHLPGLVDLPSDEVREELGYNWYDGGGHHLRFYPPGNSQANELASHSDRFDRCMAGITTPIEPPSPGAGGGVLYTTCPADAPTLCSRALQEIHGDVLNTIEAVKMIKTRGTTHAVCADESTYCARE